MTQALYMGDSRQVEVPSTTFPRLAGSPPSVSAQNTAHDLEHLPAQDPVSLDGQLLPFLIVSDASECNNNLSCFLKEVIYVLYGVRCDRNPNTGTNTETASPADRPAKNYQRISGFALKLVTLNLFTKNNILCIGKLLGLLVALSHLSFQDEEARYEGECLEEFICITLLILLKTADKSGGKKTVLLVLEDLNFIGILFGFLTTHIGTIESSSKATDTESATVLPSLTSSSSSSSSYIILKFVCDLVFEYLFLVEHLSDNEFQMLSLETDLIPTLLKHLLENDDFNNYDNTELGNDDDDVGDTKAIAYEEFKLLLLINEQYLMKSYTRPEITNKVFETLLEQSSSSSTATIPGFLNMVVCYLNREESLILKILILKFFYLIFTTSTTAKQFYLNDLKILVDIFIRELNNMEYDDSALGNSNRLLTITYLKVMYPLLVFSQLSEEIEGGYKNEQIIDLLLYLINMSSGSGGIQEEQEEVIAKLSTRCLSISWLKKCSSPVIKNAISLPRRSSSSSVTSASPLPSFRNRPELYQRLENSSQESIGAAFTRVASVRTSTKNDFHRHNTLSDKNQIKVNVLSNNNNVFLAAKMESMDITGKEITHDENSDSNILNLPKKFLGETRSASPYSRLVRKAIVKKAPPPPPTPTSRTGSQTNTPYGTPPQLSPLAKNRMNAPLPDLPVPPPPPPPRRRR